MLFTSLEFIVFFPIVVGLFFLLPHRTRWMVLLAASYVFYAAWKVEFLALIVASTVVDWFCGLRMGRHETRDGRRPWLLVSLIANLGLLGFFKYYNFFVESGVELFHALGLDVGSGTLDIVLPVGISFYTFQTLSYSIDVYRGQKEVEPNLGIFALYVSFFPQLVAGPIERSATLLPQFHERQRWDWPRIRLGLTQMLLGFWKKLVLADRLSLYVDEVYAHAADYPGLPMWTATYFFALQVYCDFSGYSDIAIGGARVMGFDLMTNFKRPYLADSFKSFWARWHISLTTWFRDYVCFPMGGSRGSPLRTRFNMLALFTLCGLWHGARWNCVLWGTANGVYLVMGQLTEGAQRRFSELTGLVKLPWVRKVFNVVLTFHLFVISLMIWRSETIPKVGFNIAQAFTPGDNAWKVAAPMDAYELAIAVIGLLMLLVLEIFQERHDSELLEEFERRPAWIRWPVYYAVLFSILIFGVFELKEFVYFQF